MKINTELLGKIGSAMVTAGQTIDPDAVGFDFGTLKKKKKKDNEGEAPEVKDAPKPKPPETDSTNFTKEELEIIGRNEILGYCSGEDQELYFKMANSGKKITFDL